MIPRIIILWLVVPYHSLNDLDFMVAQEQWIQTSSPLSTPPEPAKTFKIKMLAASYERCRKLAMRRLKRASYVAPRWLFWRIRDPEINYRQKWIASRVFVCELCEGSGYCQYYQGNGIHCRNCGRYRDLHGKPPIELCWGCGATGNLYKFSGWYGVK